MTVRGDLLRRVAGVIDQDLLGDEEQPARGGKRSTSNVPSGRRNFIRLMLARLHAVSSRNMYSLQGFDALIARYRDRCASG